MADSFTTVLGLIKQETGGNNNTWGENLNDQVIQYLEDKLCGHTAVSTTGGTTTLTQAQCRCRHIDVTGVLVSDATIVVPNTTNGWIINNGTTGNFGVIVKTSGGSASCSVPQGTSKEVNCDGSNGVTRVDRNIAGVFFFHAGATAPSGAQECDGSAWKRTRAPEAYTALGTTWGAGNGVDDFVFPDGKTAGKFLRARTGSVAVGTSQSDQNAAHTHTGTTDSTTSTGSLSTDGAHSHTITITDPGHSHTIYAATSLILGSAGGWLVQNTTGDQNRTSASSTTGISASSNSTGSHTHTLTMNAHTHTFTTGSSGGSEARPTNLSGMLCVWL